MLIGGGSAVLARTFISEVMLVSVQAWQEGEKHTAVYQLRASMVDCPISSPIQSWQCLQVPLQAMLFLNLPGGSQEACWAVVLWGRLQGTC